MNAAGRQFLHNPSPDEMPRSADVVVIGGGPTGAAALWALERLAPGTRAVLVEKTERLGAGSSLASLENYRSCWPTPCLARQMARSIEVLQQADDYFGAGAAAAVHLKQRGYLFCAFTPAHAATLMADVQHMHAIGVSHIEYLDADEVNYRFPWLHGRVIAAKFDPLAGWLDSNALVHTLARSAPSARILLGAGDVSLCMESGRVTGVRTRWGVIAAPRVLVAAGAGAVEVMRSADLDLPVVLRPRQSFTTSWRHEAFPEDGPMLIGQPPFPHVRPEAKNGAIFGYEYRWHTKNAPNSEPNATHDGLRIPVENLNALKDPRFPSLTLALMARQFGHAPNEGFADARYLKGIYHNIGYYVFRDESAAYQITPDGGRMPYDSERAIIGPYSGVEGLYLSVAHVGHGIMSAPAAGEISACHLLGLPLPDPLYADFDLNAHWVEHDISVL